MFSICLGDKPHITNEVEDVPDVIEINVEDDSQTETCNFSPISEEWRKEIGKKFGIPYIDTKESVSYNYGGTFHIEREPTERIKVIGDGNCLFGRVSHAVTGSQDHHNLLCQLTVEQMPKMGKTFRQFSDKDAKDYFNQSKMDQIGTWGTEVELFTLVSLLELSIFIFLHVCHKRKESIYLVNENQHFDLVLDI